jgi:hypothetical protein
MESPPPQSLLTGVNTPFQDLAAPPSAPARTSSLTARQQPTRSARSADRPFIETPSYQRRAPVQPVPVRNPRDQFLVQSHAAPEPGISSWDDSREEQHNQLYIPDIYATPASISSIDRNREKDRERQREVERPREEKESNRDRERTVRPVYSARGVQRRDSYPPDTPSPSVATAAPEPAEPQTPVPSAMRGHRGSIGAGTGGRPTVSFYDARDYMHSGGGGGRRMRPDSWSSSSIGPKGSSSPLVEPTPPSVKRPHGDLESGLVRDRNEPPSRPPLSDHGRTRGPQSGVFSLNPPFKNHIFAAIGEFIGTTMFLFLAFSGTLVTNVLSDQIDLNPAIADAATASLNLQRLVYISLSFGFSLMVNVWIFFRISGGIFNPAVSISPS